MNNSLNIYSQFKSHFDAKLITRNHLKIKKNTRRQFDAIE